MRSHEALPVTQSRRSSSTLDCLSSDHHLSALPELSYRWVVTTLLLTAIFSVRTTHLRETCVATFDHLEKQKLIWRQRRWRQVLLTQFRDLCETSSAFFSVLISPVGLNLHSTMQVTLNIVQGSFPNCEHRTNVFILYSLCHAQRAKF